MKAQDATRKLPTETYRYSGAPAHVANWENLNSTVGTTQIDNTPLWLTKGANTAAVYYTASALPENK